MLGIVLLSVLVAVAVAGLCGLLNGVLVAKVKIPPILATLGTMKLYEGISLVITRGSPITSFPKPFLFIGSGSLLHVPFPADRLHPVRDRGVRVPAGRPRWASASTPWGKTPPPRASRDCATSAS